MSDASFPSPFLDTPSVDSLPSSWAANTKHNKNENAASADDAEVPISFWKCSLAHKLGLIHLSVEQSEALGVIRQFSVNHLWCKSITKYFCAYIRCYKCHSRNLSQRFVHHSEPLNFNCKKYKLYKWNIMKLNGVEVDKAKGWLTVKDSKVRYKPYA